MAYTPYNQALPDTSRYNIDPVLLERLYQPSRQDPYQAGMLQEQNADYYADPFAYTNNKFGVGTSLDELLKKEGGVEGLFSSPLVSNEGGGDFGGEGGTPNGSFGLGMGVDGVDAGLGGPGSGVGMSAQQGGILGGIIGSLFGVPAIGYQVGKTLSESTPTTNTPMSVANNARANAIPVDPHVQAAAAAVAAAAQASNVAEGGGGYSGPGGVNGSGVSEGGGNAALGFGIGGW
jgi:hypothetical protein